MENNGNSYEFSRIALNDDSIINSLTEEHLEKHKSYNLQNVHENKKYYKDTKHLKVVETKLTQLLKIDLQTIDERRDDAGEIIRTQKPRVTHYTPTQQKKLHDSFADRGIVLSELP